MEAAAQSRTSESAPNGPPIEFLRRLPHVLDRVGVKRSTFYAWIRKGLFTKPVSLGGGIVAWTESEIAALVAARVCGASDEQICALVIELQSKRKHIA